MGLRILPASLTLGLSSKVRKVYKVGVKFSSARLEMASNETFKSENRARNFGVRENFFFFIDTQFILSHRPWMGNG
jgi:hypothetical protein